MIFPEKKQTACLLKITEKETNDVFLSLAFLLFEVISESVMAFRMKVCIT